MNVEDDALRVLYEGILDGARQAFAFAQAARSRVTEPCDDGADHAAEQQYEPVIVDELRHKPVQERSSSNRAPALVSGRMDVTMHAFGATDLDDRALLANV